MEIPIKFIPRYPWLQMEVGDHFTPPDWVNKHTVIYRAKEASSRFRPMKFAAKTTKGRWEIRRVK